MKPTFTRRLNPRWSALSIALAMSLSAGWAQTTNVIVHDTFDDGAGGFATRMDDLGASYGRDIQWRPRVSNQAGSYSVVSDTEFGPALQFHNTANNLWIIGQFDNNASDDIAFGSSSVPVTLGGNAGDVLLFSMKIRTVAALSSGSFKCGLTLVPGGPRADDGSTDNTWVNLCTGYYVTIPNGAGGLVATCKQTGVTGVTPFGGTAQTILTNGITGVTTGMGKDTLGHLLVLKFTRVSAASVQIDAYWDGTLVSTVRDNGSPYSQFNTVMMLYGAVTDYILDDVKLEATSTSLGYEPPIAINDSYSLAKNSVMTVAAPGVLSNDSVFTNAPLSAVKLTDPTHGSVTSFTSTGGFVYTPNSNFFGTDSFTYQANDGLNNSQPATVTLTVIGNTIWTGAADTSWANAGNWSSGDLPAGQIVRYDNTSAANLTQTLDQNWSITGLVVSNVSGPITLAGGFALTNSGAANLANATADLAILANYAPSSASPAAIGAGRTLTVSNVLGNLNNAAGPGTLRVKGAMTGTLMDLTSSLTLLLDGGTVAGTPPVRLTAETGGTVRVVVTNGGMIDLNSGNSVKINVGNNASTTGNNILTLESGTIKVAASSGTGAAANNGIFVPGSTCNGIFSLNGGTVILTNKQTAATNIASETTLRIPGNAAGNGVVNLNGGVLITPLIDGAAVSSGSGVLNFNGTVVTANRSNDMWIAGVQNAYVLAGGAIFDTAGYDVTIAQSLAAPLTGTGGGLIKRGGGILRLTGMNSYTGPTVVASDTLAVAASSGAYPNASPLVMSNGAILRLDVSSGSTLVMPAATLNGATLNLDFGTLSGNPGAAAINNSSYSGITLSASGTNTINIAGSGFTAGDVPLIDYSGTMGGSGFAALRLGSMPLGLSGTLINDTANSMIVLRLGRAPNSLTWFGDKNANWDTTTANWNGGAAKYTEVGGLGDIVTFDDNLNAATANTNINLTATLKPVSVTVNSYGYNYRFAGAGKLSGPGSLSKDANGALTLATANDFTGGSFLTNGVVYLANNAALGAGPVTLMGATLSSDGASARTLTNAVNFGVNMFTTTAGTFGDGVNPGAITLTGPVDWSGAACTLAVNSGLTFSGTLANGGLDAKTGPGTLTFQNATDATTLGNLQVQDGSVIVGGGTLRRANGGIRVMAYNSPAQRASFSVSSGAAVLLDGPNINLRIGNYIGDSGATNIVDITGTVSCTANDMNGAVQIGTNCALAQLNLRAGGLLRVGSFTAQGPASEVNLYGGTLAGTVNQSGFMQGLGACYVRSGGVIVNTEGLSGQPLSLTIAQALLDGGGGGGLTKTGQGTLVLSGTNTYTGPTVVNAGTLQLNSGQLAPSAITVADGATLAFWPVAPGLSIPVNTATLGSSTGAWLTVTFSGSTSPTTPAVAVNSLTLNGVVRVNVQVGAVDAGSIPLVSYTSHHGSGSVTAGMLPAGLVGTVTNDTSAKLIKLIVTRAPPAVAVFNDTFEPDGGTVATRNDDAGAGYGLDIQWRPRGNGQGANYAVTNDAVLGNALQFNSGTSQFLFSIGQFDNDASDGVVFDTNSAPATLGDDIGDSLKLSMDLRTPTNLPAGYAFKVGLMMAPNGPTPIDTTTGNGWTADWTGYALSMNNGSPGPVLAFKQYPTYDTTDSLLKTGTNVIFLTNEITGGTAVALGADTGKHTLTMQLTRADATSLRLEAYWDNALVFKSLDTNAPGFTNFNSVAMSYGQVGVFLYDNVTLSKIQAVPTPVAIADAYPLGANTALVVAAPGVLSTDTDPSAYPLTAIRVTSPAHGTLNLDASGGFTYTPTADYVGNDSFSYQANNGFAGSPVTLVSLVITNSVAAPPLLSASVSGSDLVLSGTGGTPGATAYLLTSTNVALPMSSWTAARSVVLDSTGSFSFTNGVSQTQSQQFFRVLMP